MTVENVKMDVCKQAIQIADEKGNKNGMLDENEFSVFAKNALELGVATSEIEKVCTEEAAKNVDDANNIIEKLKTLKEKENKLHDRVASGGGIGFMTSFALGLSAIGFDLVKRPQSIAYLMLALIVCGTIGGYQIANNSHKSKQLKAEINQIKADMGVEIKETA